MANATAALATIAGASSGSRTRPSWFARWGAEVGRRLLELGSDRDEPATHDDDNVRQA